MTTSIGTGDTTLDFFGLQFSTKQAGVAAIALGAATIILTFRKVLKTVVDLGRILFTDAFEESEPLLS